MKSMTGYGQHSELIDGLEIEAEIKSVNHRYSDCNVRVPRHCGFLEDVVRKHIASRINRGKIDVFVGITDRAEDGKSVKINESLADGYIHALKTLHEKHGLGGEVTIDAIAGFTDIFETEYKERDEESLTGAALTVVERALVAFLDMRACEGEKLKTDMRSRIDTIAQLLKEVEERAPRVVEEYRQKLEERVKGLISGDAFDEARVLTEVAVMADRLCTTEEIVRLESHLRAFCSISEEDAPVGRKLDFLLQEMNREINTIGSKANDLEISKIVVEMKAELEKIREQIQNIE